MPKTYLAFLIGSLALVGIPPLSGFFSKDAILASALASGGYGQFLFVVGLVGALLTGLYTFRLLFLVFLGEPSPLVQEHAEGHGHGEGPWTMIVAGRRPRRALGRRRLARRSRAAGTPSASGSTRSRSPVSTSPSSSRRRRRTTSRARSPSVSALVGIYVAWVFYGARKRPVPHNEAVQDVLEHKFWFDELYDLIFYKPAVLLTRGLRRGVEEPLIGGSISGVSVGTRETAGAVGGAQTGYLRSYALVIAFAVAILVVVFVTVQ